MLQQVSKQYQQMNLNSCIKGIIAILIAYNALLILACNNKSKIKFFISNKVCNSIIREKYVVGSWGALTAETYSDYLTDSINFRVFIGNHGEDENFQYDCVKDSIYVIKLSIKGLEKAKAIDTLKVYSIIELKRNRIFE